MRVRGGTAARATREAGAYGQPALNRALEAAGMVAWEWDLATDRVTHAGAALALWRADGAEAADLLAAVHPDDRVAVRRARDAVATAAGGVYRCEYRVAGVGGGWRWLESRGRVEDAAGGQRRIVGVSLDVTDRKRAEEALRESEIRYRGLFEGANDAIILVDLASGRYLDWNRRAEELTGYGPDELPALRLGDLAAPEHRESAVAHLRGLREGDGLVVDHELLAKDGRRVPVELSGRL
ncbi:MAG TPA: PAS domain S-box protein, partial [Geminicoccaceae bacterium]